MTCLQLWTVLLMATMVLPVSVDTAEESGLPDVEREKRGPAEIVRKESHPILLRRKREWIWNSLYVEEEKPAPVAYKIGQLKSNKESRVKKFKIEGEGANDIFLVDDKGDLFVSRSLDREKKSSYHLTAEMLDGNGDVIEQAGNFIVHVNDINDNSPVFLQTFNGSIMEGSNVGTKILQVKASDDDDPTTANGILKYSLIQGDISAFNIDSESGVISCKTDKLDRETKSQYVVVVQAQDMRGLQSGSTATTSVTITITDANDNMASFTRETYELEVPENKKLNEKIGTLVLEDRDQIQNKEPIFTILGDTEKVFHIERSPSKDGNLLLEKPLDYEKKNKYVFSVQVEEDLQQRVDNKLSARTKAEVIVRVTDVNEPPVFSSDDYTFTVLENEIVSNIGRVTATDPDKDNRTIRYSILDKDCPIGIHPLTGQLSTHRKLDREEEPIHIFQVKAQEEPNGLEAFVKVKIIVQDVNDNKPELPDLDIIVCEKDVANTVIGTLRATDKDDQPPFFTFSLASESSNFSIKDHGNNTADIVVKRGPFSLDDPNDYSVDISISDGGRPLQTSVSPLMIKLCQCNAMRIPTRCRDGARRTGVSVHALIAILLCILTILVIVILFVMRKRYQKDSLAGMKNSGEIHEQLVTYDEEGGGEMDTNGYDVSILTSACHDGSLLRHPDLQPHPSLYAMVQKPPHHAQPTACKGDMAAMIEVKKDEADHDGDGVPYDTLHIYGYEGPGSVAGSLSSLDSSSTGSNLDYDFLSDWGPRFSSLAELYGVDGSDDRHQD